jgi:hypothetical protein
VPVGLGYGAWRLRTSPPANTIVSSSSATSSSCAPRVRKFHDAGAGTQFQGSSPPPAGSIAPPDVPDRPAEAVWRLPRASLPALLERSPGRSQSFPGAGWWLRSADPNRQQILLARSRLSCTRFTRLAIGITARIDLVRGIASTDEQLFMARLRQLNSSDSSYSNALSLRGLGESPHASRRCRLLCRAAVTSRLRRSVSAGGIRERHVPPAGPITATKPRSPQLTLVLWSAIALPAASVCATPEPFFVVRPDPGWLRVAPSARLPPRQAVRSWPREGRPSRVLRSSRSASTGWKAVFRA